MGYQRGEIDAASYVEGFVHLLGPQGSSRLFPEVAQLLTLTPTPYPYHYPYPYPYPYP